MSANSFPLPLRPEVESLEISGIQKIWELGFGRADLIGLWVGEGDLPTPGFISDAAIAALQDGQTFYTHKRGLPELREAVARYLARLHGFPVEAERISVTSSGMTAIVLILQAILRPGDRVAIVSPIWPNITSAVRIAGGEAVAVSLDASPDGGFTLDIDKLASALDERTRAVFIATPSNPTGWMMEADQQRAVLELCRERGVWIIADEVYHRFTYDRPHAPSFLSLAGPDDPVIAVHSFSKAWAMTGWRVGWLVHPPSMGETFGKLIEFSTSGGQAFLQAGCLAAIEKGEAFVAEMVERCRQGAEIVFQGLSRHRRVRIARPQAAFYAFFAVEGLQDSLAGAREILERTGVGLAPGSAFGEAGEGYLRLCFASSAARLQEAMERLEVVLGD